MSWLFRLGMVIAVLLPGAAATPRGTVAADGLVVQAAALRLGHASPSTVIRWLRSRPEVRSARLGRDHATVDIAFRGGARAVILPRSSVPSGARMPRRSLPHSRALPLARARGEGGGRALVLEPFATELGFSPTGYDPVVSYLQQAGYAVDVLHDSQVTIDTMATLSRYNVVYDFTHSGVNDDGTGVIATAQQEAACAFYVSPDHTIEAVAISGSKLCYYGVTATYIENRVPPFAKNSVVFLNGCSLLKAKDIWPALSGRGVGVMLSWDADATAADDFYSAGAYFNELARGMTISGALDSIRTLGYAASLYKGQAATLDYRGDGSITLQEAAASIPPPVPTSIATDTPEPLLTITPTAVPTTAALPLPSSTPIPPAVSLTLARSAVKPGVGQVITVRNLTPGSSTEASVTFPNGDVLPVRGMADEHGVAQLRFVQPGSKITRHGHEATVTVTGTSPAGPYGLRQQYRVGYGAIDVSVQPRRQAPGKVITIWVHTARHKRVDITVSIPGVSAGHLVGISGPRGWAHVAYRLSGAAKGGKVGHIAAVARLGSRQVHGAVSFRLTRGGRPVPTIPDGVSMSGEPTRSSDRAELSLP